MFYQLAQYTSSIRIIISVILVIQLLGVQLASSKPTLPDEDVNNCTIKPSVCLNGAKCINKPGGHHCICVNGWTGSDCSENVDDCSTAACEAGATCHDRVGHFFCECPPGRIGLLCQLDDGCFHNPCHPNATCDASPVDGSAHCTCPPGFSGTDCSIDNDECAMGSPCEHGGSCVNTPGSYRCECPSGFTGTRCEININECENNPCMNEGTCLDEKGSFQCICMNGFTGPRCEVEKDECASNPCQNGATCQDKVNSFRCLCQPGYWGERCEYPLNNSQLSQNSIIEPAHQDPPPYLLGKHNPWVKCSNAFACWTAFKDGKCDQGCNTAECLYDGNDCIPVPDKKSLPSPSSTNNYEQATRTCDEQSETFCLKKYANGVCDLECNSAECGWDGADCEVPGENQLMPATSTEAQGLLVIRVEPAIKISESRSHPNIELARLLRQLAVSTKTILKIQNFRQLEEGRGTEIELIADNRKCQDSCYNTTELMARFFNALKDRTPAFNDSMKAGLNFEIWSQPGSFGSERSGSASSLYIIVCGSLAAVCALLMVISIGGKQRVKEKATVWFPEGFKPVLSSRSRDPTNRKASRDLSTLQAIGGNFFRGIRRNEKNISTDPSGLHSTDLNRGATPNGGGIYHEPYDQYDQYGTYNGTESGSMVHNIDEPLTPPPMTVNPINIEGPHGLTPLMVASMGAPFSKEPLGLVAYGTTGEMNGSADNNVTDLLHRGAQLNLANKVTGETALHLAARHGRVDSARGLLERCDSQDVNAQDATGRTPLHTAIAADSLGVFELLIRCRGTDLNAQTHDGTTPLILATRVGTFSMLEELIQNECEVTKSDINGKTALHWAAATNNVDAIRRLLDVHETNKDAQNHNGETPLFLAAREGAKGAVEILLSRNANKDISNDMDQSPIQIATMKNHTDIIRLLEEHEPPTPRSITSVHASSRQSSPFSPVVDCYSNSNSSTAPPPPSYHSHTQSGRLGGRQAQKAALARSNSTKPLIAEANVIRNNLQNHCQSVTVIKSVYNVPCLKNYMTPSPDSPFSNESSMASPPGTYSDQQYQNPNHPSLTSQKQAGVFI